MTIDLRLADLVASRLCHDLVGPAGAVAAGLELLEQPSDMDPECQSAECPAQFLPSGFWQGRSRFG